MKQILVEVFENIKKIRKNRKDNLKTLSKERAAIECEIQHTRIIINKHLEKIKKDMMTELNEVEKQENKAISQFIKLLEESEKEIAECQRKISSNTHQTFLAVKQLEKDVFLKEKCLQSLVDKNTIKQFTLIY